MRDKLILIDGHSIINRAFYGMPDLTNSKGVHTGAVYGFLNIMFRILDEEKATGDPADYLLVAFDTHAPTFRHAMFAEYKGTRKPMPEELRPQVPLLQEVLKAMGIAIYAQEGLEADDILGTYAKRSAREGMEVTLVSGDRDLLQISDEHICVRIPKTVHGQTTIENYHPQDVMERYHITPAQVIEIKGLMGDSSDNIPGVPKVGEKTAQQLLELYGSVDGVYAHLAEITKKGLHDTLAANEDKARLSLQLATIKTDCELPDLKDSAAIGNFYTKEAFALFTELNFRNFLNRFDNDMAAPTETEKQKVRKITDRSEAEDAFAVIKAALRKGTPEAPACIGLWPVFEKKPQTLDTSAGEQMSLFSTAGASADSTDTGAAETADPDNGKTSHFIDYTLFAAAAATEGKIWYFVPGRGGKESQGTFDAAYLQTKFGQLRRLVQECESTARIACFDIKNLFPCLDIRPDEFTEGIRLEGMEDLLLCCYLCNPLKNDYTAEDCVSEYLSAAPQSYLQLFGKESVSEAFAENPDRMQDYSAQMADFLRKACPAVTKRLTEEGMRDLYRKIELPLSYILYDMQRIGIRIRPSALEQYSRDLGKQADELQTEIFRDVAEATGSGVNDETAVTEFNIGSPKQLGEILFEKMHLPGGKKTKTGWSTSADVLEKLAPECPVVRKILDWRGVTKLKSTYADGLSAFIGPDLRIHTTFNQTITATGRISSTDPNLQNIPMRTEMGRQIRKAFIPKDGAVFTDADYSQIELRILACMSNDPELIEAFRQNQDIHRMTASRVFHTPFDEVTPLQRRNAKAVNFGIVYGISAFGLSQDLSIPRQEAQDYIESYFQTYPQVKAYLDNCVEEAKKNGYVTTLYGRRRPIPELTSGNFMMRQFGERVAMNSPIQGTAADIMKIAMIRVWERLHREHRASELILQIHDELLVETAPGEEEAVSAILSEEMSHAADLPVLLDTDVHAGTDWYEAK
jgi:DNA polymerase-1